MRPAALQFGLTTEAAGQAFVAEITEATGERRGVGMSPLLVSAWKHKPRPQSLDRLAAYARYCLGLQYVAKAGGWASIPAHGVDHPNRAKQFEALPTAARESPNPCDFTLVAMLGLLGLRIFEATGADISDPGEEHGHRVLRIRGKGTRVVLIPLPPAVGRAIDRVISTRTSGPILLNSRDTRMDRHVATRRLSLPFNLRVRAVS
jgi:integrase